MKFAAEFALVQMWNFACVNLKNLFCYLQ